MLEASVKEYELLKKEVQSIKDCITKYVGYIIASNGIAYSIFGTIKLYTEAVENAQLNSWAMFSAEVLLGVEIIIVISIYYIINYKFASHNRYIGYMQLLSQEIFHCKIDSIQDLSSTDLDKGYLCKSIKPGDLPQHIFSWDYVNSKWNNRTNTKEYPEHYYDQLDVRLQLPNKYKSYKLNFDKVEGNAIQLFFKNIIWDGFNIKLRRFYKKFVITSWQYPKHIYSLTMILLAISLYLFLRFHRLASINTTYVYGFALIVFAIFIYYSIDLYKLLKKNKTIDFYCWAFLSYRVKLLNNYKIRPVYHSTSFQRYFKSLKVVELIQSLEAYKKGNGLMQNNLSNEFVDLKKLSSDIKEGLKLSGKQKRIVKLLKTKIKNKEKNMVSNSSENENQFGQSKFGHYLVINKILTPF